MSNTSFGDLCKSFCEAAALQMPLLALDESGTTSLSLQVDGIDITLTPHPHDPAAALSMAALGFAPPDRELPALLGLLEANFLLDDDAPLSFGCAPSGGEAVLMATHGLAQTDGSRLLQHVTGMAALARQWREGLLDETVPSGSSAPH